MQPAFAKLHILRLNYKGIAWNRIAHFENVHSFGLAGCLFEQGGDAA